MSTPKFLYPRARIYAFDEVCEQIVRALEKRHFDVLGIQVEFSVYGRGEQFLRYVKRVSSHDFCLSFGRGQGSLPEGTFNDIAAVRDVTVPREQISVYEDHSGPSYHAYVGDDWERDREWFYDGWFVNSKLNGEPRRYLTYKGSDEIGRQVRRGYRRAGNACMAQAKYLLHTNDLGREYECGENDPQHLTTSDVTKRMTAHLRMVLARIEETPERDEPFAFVEEPEIPTNGCPEFWTYAEQEDVSRIHEGQSNVEELRLADRYALQPGWRLIPYDHSAKDLGHDPKLLHDGFVWCSLDPQMIPREAQSGFREQTLVRVHPKRLNRIYVVDEAAYDRVRAEISARIDAEGQTRTRFTNAEVGEMYRARAKTITPWAEYDGSFEKPVVIIGRELSFDEVLLYAC